MESTKNTSPEGWTLFLDDERDPSYELYDALIARTVDEAKSLIGQFGLPSIISFDHDLGKNIPTGYDLLKWLMDEHLDERLDLAKVKRVIVHSANPIGAENIEKLWNGMADNFLSGIVRAEMKPRTHYR